LVETKRIYNALFVLFCLISGGCQKSLYLPSVTEQSITLAKQDTIHQLYLAPQGKRVNLYPDRMFYYYYGGSLGAAEGDFIGRVLHGSYTCFTRDKTLVLKGEYKYGLKNGPWKAWYPNGRLHYSKSWKKGLENGEFHSFYANGVIKKKGRYKKSLKKGIWIENYKNGLSKQQAEFKKGNLHGKYLEFDSDGQLKVKANYKEGVLHGPYRIYDDQGNVKEKLFYRKGKLKIKEEEASLELKSKPSDTSKKKLFFKKKKQREDGSTENEVKEQVGRGKPSSGKAEEKEGEDISQVSGKKWWLFWKRSDNN
jgi:hypothetical protein